MDLQGFLQQRYDAAVSRYREAVTAHVGDQEGNQKNQVLLHRRRCQVMTLAIVFGLLSAILLIASLILAAIDVMAPNNPIINAVGIVCAIGRFVFVIVAAVIVIAEGRIVSRQINDQLRDVPNLAERAGKSFRG